MTDSFVPLHHSFLPSFIRCTTMPSNICSMMRSIIQTFPMYCLWCWRARTNTINGGVPSCNDCEPIHSSCMQYGEYSAQTRPVYRYVHTCTLHFLTVLNHPPYSPPFTPPSRSTALALTDQELQATFGSVDSAQTLPRDAPDPR